MKHAPVPFDGKAPGGNRRGLFASAAAIALAPAARFEMPFRPGAVAYPPEEEAGDDFVKPAEAWRFVALLEILNFAPLRRHLGAPRADCLVLDLADRVVEAVPGARLAVVGRTTIEIAFERRALDDVSAAVDRLAAIFAEAIDLDGEPHRVEVAIGAAAAPAASADDVRLAEEAEAALEQARTDHAPTIRNIAATAPVYDRHTLINDLRAALDRSELFLQYQPKVHLRRQEVCSVEALIRWQHPTRGLILPGDFIPAAEDARLIGPMTLWTIEQAMADQRALAAIGRDIPVFVNVSGQLLGDATFVARACQMVSETNGRIGFEITETSVIRDPATAIAHLQLFAEMGIPVAIDDYGAGLSSLAYLKQLPAAELKIDKMFVVQLTSSNRDPLIVRSTIDLAHALDMEVTAEGVETQAALALLSVMGCDMVQGFLISRPLTIAALCHFLRDQQPLAALDLRASFNRPASFWKSA